MHLDDIMCEISGLACDSRIIKVGNMFFAIRGNNYNGVDFINSAIENGAVAIIVQNQDEAEARKKIAELGITITLYGVDDVRQSLALAAKQFFQIKDNEHPIFAVTGTNGKTTITYLIKYLMDRPTALIGTIEYDLIDKILPSSQTTPNIIELYSMFAKLQKNTAIALEVSSHALDQKRIYGLAFDVAIFSNLTNDHLDYHGNQEQYFLAKYKLFSGENGARPKLNIFNLNDYFGWRLYNEFGGISYGVENLKNDYNGHNLQFYENETIFSLQFKKKKYHCRLPMIGQHNVENSLAAIATVHNESKQSIEEILAKLETFPGVPGRLQKIKNDRGVLIFIDYAHTEDGLRRVLESLQKIKQHNLITVFGCGGNRDKAKRASMMRVACQFSNEIIATSDNPRHEQIASIFDDMKLGISFKSRVIFEPERSKAIRLALKKVKKGDVVLVAGKGHEIYQQIGDEKILFNDEDVIRSFLLS